MVRYIIKRFSFSVLLQKRSRSLELSALHPSQQLQQNPNSKPRHNNGDKTENNGFNYHNVLPLFNVQETIRPTTYRPQLLVQPSTIDPKSLEGADHRFSQKQTNGYLPLNQFGQQYPQQQFIQQIPLQQPLYRHFVTPSVQIVPSIALNEDNGLINRAHFNLGPPLNQQFALDPAYINQQIQYDQYGNAAQTQPQFLINVQEEQIPYQRAIRKESSSPNTANLVPRKEGIIQPKSAVKSKSVAKNATTQTRPKPQETTVVQTVASHQLQPESFSIPIIPVSTAVTVSPAVLAHEFEQSSLGIQPQVRQATVPNLSEVLTVPATFLDDGFFSTNFGRVETLPIVPAVRPTKLPSRSFVPSTTRPSRPASRLRAFTPQTSFFKDTKSTPDGSFSRYVINTKSGVFDTFVKY